jgi:hypothetical protein
MWYIRNIWPILRKEEKIETLDFINHKLIDEVFSERKYYSFGISTENQGRVLNSGVDSTKK